MKLMHRAFTLCWSLSVVLLVTSFGTEARAQNLTEQQKKAMAELKEQDDLADKRGIEKVVSKNATVFREIFDVYDGWLSGNDDADTWKTANHIAELLDQNSGTNEFTKKLECIKNLSLEQREQRISSWQEFNTIRNELTTAWKNREKDKVNELIPKMQALADTFQKLNDQLLRGYALCEVAKILNEDNQKPEAQKMYNSILEGLKSVGYDKLRFQADCQREIDKIASATSSGGGGSVDGGVDGSTMWSADAAGQKWSDPIPLKYTANEKLPWSKITTPSFCNSEDTLQWIQFGLNGNAGDFDRLKPLGRQMKLKREGNKTLLDDGSGKFREVKVTSKPNLVEVEKEFQDPWTKENVKQKYAFLLGTGSESEGFFGIQINQAPTKEFQAMRIAPACFLKGTVLGQEVRIIDDNVTGKFGDGGDLQVPGYTQSVTFPFLDAMCVGSSNLAQPFSEYIEAGGDFYRLKMSSDDEAYSVKTRKLAVDTGTVVLEFKNKLKPEALIIMATDKFKGAYFNIASGKPVRVPCDRYKVCYGILRAGKKESMQSCLIVASAEMTSLEVKKDQETKFELGAPFHYVFEAAEVGNGDVKIVGKSVAVKGRGKELYVRYWDSPPIPEAVQIFRDGKSVGKPLPMKRLTFEDFKKANNEVAAMMFPLDLTLPGNGSANGKLGVSMKLKKPQLLDGPIETGADDKHD